jgi:hypothetical protein
LETGHSVLIAILRSAAVPAAAECNGKAFNISGISLRIACAAGEDTRAPFIMGNAKRAEYNLIP